MTNWIRNDIEGSGGSLDRLKKTTENLSLRAET
jgi:hypothetical protein